MNRLYEIKETGHVIDLDAIFAVSGVVIWSDGGDKRIDIYQRGSNKPIAIDGSYFDGSDMLTRNLDKIRAQLIAAWIEWTR